MRNERDTMIIFDHISIQDCAICDTILIRLHAECPWFRLGFLIFCYADYKSKQICVRYATKKYILVRFQVAHGFAYGFVKINLHVFNMEACFCCGKEMKNVIATFYLKIQAFYIPLTKVRSQNLLRFKHRIVRHK